ncbi:MAG: LysR substrate-binding domain-containing protein [Parahaliea sp.]
MAKGINLRSVDLNLLTVFDAVMAERNISKAAREIGMSQPAVSAALARLRIMLKDELFVRTGRGVRPTSRAAELEMPIRHILSLVCDTLAPSVEFDVSRASRRFILASMDYAGVLLAPALIKRLSQLDSPITLSMCSSNDQQLAERMRFGAVDFTIDYQQLVDDEIHVVKIAEEEVCCLFNPKYSDFGENLSLEKYLSTKQIVLTPYDRRVSVLDEHLKSLDVARQRTMTVPSMLNYPHVLVETDLICTLPKRIGEVFARDYGLQLTPLPLEGFVVTYYLMWHSSMDRDPAHRWMRETIISLCDQL